MQQYLIHKTENIYGSKGFADDQIDEKYISDNPIFSLVKEGNEFHYDIEEYDYETREELEEILVKSDDHLGGQDGYTNSTYSYSITPVDNERADEIKDIIYAYCNL